MTEGKITPIEPGLIQRVVQGVRYMVTGNNAAWFNPGQPLAPLADKPSDETAGRRFDYPVGYNYTTQPRVYEPISFATLRGVADSYDLLRLAIETRKDQICALEWTIRPKDKKQKADGRVGELIGFFSKPDQMRDWEDWLRELMEDMLVIDAVTLYPRMTKGGQLYSLEIIDGATIKPVLDGYGRTPMPPDPAYQQILKGVPAIDYTVDELIYRPRNRRPNKVYGYSPVEQVIMTINIAMRKQVEQLSYYTLGNVPNLIFETPLGWQPDQIRNFEMWWNSVLEGQTRRQAKFVPAGMKPIPIAEPALKDDYDEWLARVICFAFSLPPTPFIKEMNRATAGNQQEQAQSEGLVPLQRWIKRQIDGVIAERFASEDLEFAWAEEEAIDPLEQAQINQIYVAAKVKLPDEVRADIGLDPLTPEQKDELNPPPPPQLAPFTGGNAPSETVGPGEQKAPAPPAPAPNEASQDLGGKVAVVKKKLAADLIY